MTNNCLKTQLKASVQNDNLPILGYFRIHCSVSDNYDIRNHYFQLNPSENVTLTISGGTFLDANGASLGTTLAISKDLDNIVRPSNTEAIIYAPKYTFKHLFNNYGDSNLFYLDLNDCDYLGSEVQVNHVLISYALGGVSNLNHTPFEYLDLNGTDIFGDVSGLSVTDSLFLRNTRCTGTLQITPTTDLNLYNTPVSYNLENLASVDIKDVDVRNGGMITGSINNIIKNNMTTLMVTNNSNVAGTLETALKNSWDGGRRNKNITINTANTGVTFNGAELYNSISAAFSANGIVLTDMVTSQEIGSFDGTNWTYNN